MRPHDLLRVWTSWKAPGEQWGEIRPISARLQARERDIAELIREPRLTAGVKAGSRELQVRNTTHVTAIGNPAPLLMRLMRKKFKLDVVGRTRVEGRGARPSFPKVERSDVELRAVFADRAQMVFRTGEAARSPADPSQRDRVRTGMRAARGLDPVGEEAIMSEAGEGAC